MLRWCLLLLLVNPAFMVGMKELSLRCQFVRQQKEELKKVCQGRFPLMVYLKFRDTFMKENDEMVIFMPASKKYVMVSLKFSELHDCDTIIVLNVDEYLCINSDTMRTIKFQNVMMYCFPFHIAIADDLTRDCVLRRDGKHSSALEKDVLRTTGCIIQYVFDNDSTGRLRFEQGTGILITLLALALRWILVRRLLK